MIQNCIFEKKLEEKKRVSENLPKKVKWQEFQHFATRKKVFLQAVKTTTCNRVFFLQNDEWFHHYCMKLVTVFWNCMKLVTVFWNLWSIWSSLFTSYFTWNWLTKKKVVMAKSHLKARFHMQTGFIFLFYCHTVSAETVE